MDLKAYGSGVKTSPCSLSAAPELAPGSPHEELGYLLPAFQIDPPVGGHAIESHVHLKRVRVGAWGSNNGNICQVLPKHIRCAH